MNLRTYLFGLTLSSIFCWAAFLIIIFTVNPYQADSLNLSFFFISLFFALLGTFALLGFYFRVKWGNLDAIYAYLGISLRQAIWFSLCIVGLLILQAFRVLTWWDGALLVSAILLFELFFRTK